MRQQPINFVRERLRLEQAAYDWAAEEFRRCFAFDPRIRSRRLIIEEGDDGLDIDCCVRSVFIDKNTGKALFRRDYPEVTAINYMIITNLSELIVYHYSVLQQFISNGVRVYRYYDGPDSGITRITGKPFPYLQASDNG